MVDAAMERRKGAGASTKLAGPDGAVVRRMNPKYPKEYIERMTAEEREIIE